ncbi:MAG: preprotein translocase subunit SecG [Ignavibacteria bacterium RBG_16_34_14]|nr:MAG: preprotein translocase subunit SecG [Ignavibacteria bacterium RBG_16_34_14]
MYILLVTICAIVSVFLIIIILMQSSKGGGLAGTFGGAGMGTVFGTRRTADFLSRATWWLAGILAMLAIITNLFFLPGQSSPEQIESIIQKNRQNVPQTPSLPQQNNPPQNR